MGVKVTDLVKEFDLKIFSRGPEDAEINLIETNRSGLQLSGFYICAFQRDGAIPASL